MMKQGRVNIIHHPAKICTLGQIKMQAILTFDSWSASGRTAGSGLRSILTCSRASPGMLFRDDMLKDAS